MLSNVISMAFDSHDNLYALDQGSHRVLLFGPDGEFIRQIGKQGEGPGEFQAPMAITVLGDGTLVVVDFGRRGFVLFDASGKYLRDVPLPDDLGTPRPGELYVRGNDVIARAMPTLRVSPGSGPPDMSSPRKSPVFRMGFADGATPVTLHEFLMDPPQVRTTTSGNRQTVMAMFSNATFEKAPTFAALADGGVAISGSVDYSIDIKDAAGRHTRVITRPIAPKKVNDRDKEDARERQRRQLKEGPRGTSVSIGGGGAVFRSGGAGGAMTDAQIEQSVQTMTFADEIPSIERLWGDPSGRLWVVRRPDRVGRDQPVDLVAPGDRYIGTITGIPVPTAVSSSGLAAWVEKNELDIERIVVRQLPADW
jgi:hypothetical protein